MPVASITARNGLNFSKVLREPPCGGYSIRSLHRVVTGCEWRLGVDRDLDGFRDGDELDAGSDPGDPASTPDNPATGIADQRTRTPSGLWLAGPNPVRDDALLRVRVGIPGPVRLDVYDVRGRLVRHIIDGGTRPSGIYFEAWDLRGKGGRRVPSGVYFVRLRTADAVRVQKLIVVR